MFHYFTWIISILIVGCVSKEIEPSGIGDVPVPYLNNSPDECYYLDEFMPIPEAMAAGKKGHLFLRYYTYKSAIYKDWNQKHIILSFYSQDDKCWSLYGEYYMD